MTPRNAADTIRTLQRTVEFDPPPDLRLGLNQLNGGVGHQDMTAHTYVRSDWSTGPSFFSHIPSEASPTE